MNHFWDPGGSRFRYSDFEYETYAPNEYQDLTIFLGKPRLQYVLVGGFLIFLAPLLAGFTQALFPSFICTAVAMGVGARFYYEFQELTSKLNDAVSRKLHEQHQRQEDTLMSVSSDAAETKRLIKEGRILMSVVVNNSPQTTVIQTGGDLKYVVSAKAASTFDQTNKTDTSLADQMALVTGYIKSINSPQAWESWNDFLEEAGKDKKPSKLEALWDRIVKHAPGVLSLTKDIVSIIGLFT